MERLAEQNSTADTNSAKSDTGTANTGNEVNNGAIMASGTKRMLYRHPQDRFIGGVCGGLGELIGLDANLVRILWIIATLVTGGGGILAYVALWMLLPVGTAAAGQVRPPTLAVNGLNMGRTAIFLIALGGLWFLANIGALPWLWGGFWRVMNIVFWPAVLIGIGYILLNYSGRGNFKLNLNWRDTKDRVQNGVAERMPTKQTLKESYNSFRQRFPLKRSRTDRIFMGVCGGIGQRIGIDPNLVRLVWAAFSVGSIGMGVLIYVLLGLFLVQEPVTALQPYIDDMQDVEVIDARTSKL
jgi:phage shock protein PspC (stress-responsive transcriptional regulator)